MAFFERFKEVDGQVAFERAPEICVEVVSLSNTPGELKEKRAFFFEAGAEGVWQCQADGVMVFYLKDDPNTVLSESSACPDFPSQF